MQYIEILDDLLEALKDQNVENVRDCAEVLWNLANNKFPITDQESSFASVLSDNLEEVAF